MKTLLAPILILSILVISSCGGGKSAGYKQLKGCNIYTLKPEVFKKDDSISVTFKKGLGLFDLASKKLLKIASPSTDGSGDSNDDVYQRFRTTVRNYESSTPEALASAWNANAVTFCNTRNQLLEISKDSTYPAPMRLKAGDAYFEAVNEWRAFVKILNQRLSNDFSGETVEDLVKKKRRS